MAEAVDARRREHEPATELARDLRLFDITMVGVGAMIGAGIFALTGLAAGEAGPGLILAFCLNGLLTLCTAMVYAEVGSAIPGAGGGYLWVKFGLPGPSAFLAGWMDWLAHAVAGSLYAAVFGAYCVWGLQTIFGWGAPGLGEHDHGTLFGLNALWFAKGLTLMVCLAFVYINYRGSSETGKTGNIITMAKIITIAIFIVFGFVAMAQGGAGLSGDAEGLLDAGVAEKFQPFLPKGMTGVLVAMGLTFIAFEGYEIIVQAGEEVVEPRRNIPRAVFLSLAIVIPVYVLVAIVCLGALAVTPEAAAALGAGPSETWRYLASLGETGVAEAANQFMPWFGMGAILLVAGAILSTMSALNATTYSSTRVSFAMGRDRYLPAPMATVSPRTRTPVVALFASGVLITVVAVALPVKQVAAATCVMFLLVFIQVNASAIFIRRKYADKLRYGYVMPLYPWIPIVAIVGQAAVAAFLFWQEPMSLWLTLGWIALGVGVFYLYSQRQEHVSKASPVLLEQKTAPVETRRRVLIPVANPGNAAALIDLATRIGGPDVTLIILHVVSIPEQLPYSAAGPFVKNARGVLDEAMRLTDDAGATSIGLVRVGHHPGRSIVDTIIERRAQTLVMGWSGPKHRGRDYRQPGSIGLSARRVLIGSEIDHVISRADANTVVLRGQLPEAPQRILIPVANPRQARYAIAVAEDVAGDGARIDLIHVVRSREEASGAGERIMKELTGAGSLETRTRRRDLAVAMNVKISGDVVQAIYEASVGCDLLIVGASAESWGRRHAFTSFHYDLATRYPGPLLMVKLRSGRAKFASQLTVEFFRSREPEP